MGHFPSTWKTANIIWIPKKDGTLRPISLLPTMGKLLDKIINKRLQFYLEKTRNIDNKQYGFREGNGTVEALHNLTGIIAANKAQGLHQTIICLDLKNAFNTA